MKDDRLQVFFESHIVQDAVLRNLQILTESTTRLSPNLKASHPDVDWKSVAGFRNVLVHDYLGISLRGVWDIVCLDLPPFQTQLAAIRTSLP